jgi:uncharacterized protein (TIRG00374 family)
MKPDRHPARKIIRETLKYLLFLSITVLLLYVSFKGISFRELWDGLKSADMYWIVASMLVGYSGFLIRARRWQFIIEPLGSRPSFRNTYDAVMLTYLANFAVPRLGEVVRCGALRRTEKIPFESLLGTVVLERVFDLVCLALITLSVVFLRLETFGNFLHTHLWQPLVDRTLHGNYTMLYIILAALVAGLAVVIAYRKRIRQWTLVAKLIKLWQGLLNGLKAGFRLRRRGLFLLYTVLLWVAYWLQACTIMQAMPETHALSGVDALFLMVVGGLGWVAPVQGGMGAYHFIVSLTLSAIYGVAREQGVVFATISHETQALVMIVFGLLSWASFLLIRKKAKPKHPTDWVA